MKKQHMVATWVAVMMGAGLCGCSSMGSVGDATNLFSTLGGHNVKNMATDLVSKTIKDPRLASLTGGKPVDAAASSGKVENQLCSMLGGGCKAPLTDEQVADAASRVTPGQSHAINEHFNSSLSTATADPSVQNKIREALGNKIPGVLAGIL
jgi:hypothetical protein